MTFRSVLERLGLVAAAAPESGYDAFISYSHAADDRLAPALQRGLQRFAKPWYRRRALRVFRDDASLSADPGLWSSIARALDGSRHLILLASPQSAQSPWVGQEAEYWREQKEPERILIVLTSGEIAWDATSSDFDWTRTTALPTELRGAFREVPRFVDLRWARESDHLSLSHPRFRDAIADLAAPVHGIPKDELAGEEVRQHRRTVRIARAAAAALACLTLASVLFGAFALLQRNEARNQRDVARSRSLVQAAATNLDGQVDLAALLSLEAFRLRPSAETRSGLVSAVQRAEHMTGVLHAGQAVDEIAFSSDGTRLAAAGTENVLIWDLEDRERAPATVAVARATELAFSADGHTLAVGRPGSVTLWSLDPRPKLLGRIRLREATALAFTTGGGLAAVGRSRVLLFDASGRARRTWPVPDVSAAVFSPDATAVVVARPRELRMIDLAGREAPVRRAVPEIFGTVAFSPDGKRVAALDLRGEDVRVWTPASGRLRPLALKRPAAALTFTPDGRSVAVGGKDGDVAFLPLGTSEPDPDLDGPSGSVSDLAYAGASVLATAGASGTVVLWDPTATASQRVLFSTTPIADLDVAQHARAVVVGGQLMPPATVLTFDDQPAQHRTLATTVTAVAIDAAGERVAVAQRGVVLHELDGGKRRIHPATGMLPILAVAFSSDSVVASAIPDGVQLYDTETDKALDPLRVDGTPSGLAFGGDGELIAVGTSRGSTVWDARDAELVHEAVAGRAVSEVALSSSGRLVASATSGRVEVWDARRAEIRFETRIDLDVQTSLAFSPDESTLAIGTGEIGTGAGELVLVDAESGRRLGAPLATPGGPVADLDFGPDGQTLVVGTQEGLVTLWDDVLWSDFQAMRERLCAVAGRSLTAEEWEEQLPGQSYRSTCP